MSIILIKRGQSLASKMKRAGIGNGYNRILIQQNVISKVYNERSGNRDQQARSKTDE